MYRVTYEKRDGTRFTRDLNHRPLLDVGDTTSNGWKILDVRVLDHNRTYSEEQYHEKILKQSIKDKRKNRIKERISFLLFHDIDLFKSQKKYRKDCNAKIIQSKIELYESVNGTHRRRY